MEIIFILLPATLLLVLLALVGYLWALNNGQFDDLDSPGTRMLIDDRPADMAQDKVE